MATEGLELLIQSADIKQLDQVVTGSCDEPLAILVPFGVHDCALMSMPK